MKALERLEKIASGAVLRMQDEVATLLGKSFAFGEVRSALITKGDFFDSIVGKHVLAHADLEGELTGAGCMLVPLKDAIRIGGTLIMLPEAELDAVSLSEEYTEELEDSFGEVANIIAGSMTSTFEENYPKAFRLVRKQQEVLVPAKVDAESEVPVPDGTYFYMAAGMKLQDAPLGVFHLLLPAVPFGLVEAPAEPEPEAVVQEKPQVDTVAQQYDNSVPARPGKIESVPDEEVVVSTAPDTLADNAETAETPVQTASPAKKKDPAKIKERLDKLLEACRERIASEVGALLGSELILLNGECRFSSKGELLEQCSGKQILARLDIRGDASGESFLFLSLKDAIYLGGSLIMLPDSELEETVRNDDFGPDAEDAYGEITNIIAGVYTAVFEEQFSRNLGFVKTKLEKIIPVKIDPDTDETLPNLLFYRFSASLQLKNRELGRFIIAFPAAVLEIESLAQPEVVEPAAAVSGKSTPAKSGSPGASGSTPSARAATLSQDVGQRSPDVLVISDTPDGGGDISAILQQFGYLPRQLSFQDDVSLFLPGEIQLVFLVMAQVTEQGFGVAIKVSSVAGDIPLVVAGPVWTRSTVLKAVKYGADDILVTPVLEEDIQQKMEVHLGRKAA